MTHESSAAQLPWRHMYSMWPREWHVGFWLWILQSSSSCSSTLCAILNLCSWQVWIESAPLFTSPSASSVPNSYHFYFQWSDKWMGSHFLQRMYSLVCLMWTLLFLSSRAAEDIFGLLLFVFITNAILWIMWRCFLLFKSDYIGEDFSDALHHRCFSETFGCSCFGSMSNKNVIGKTWQST